MKKLCDIINSTCDIEISGVASDSRMIEKGFLFVAVNGFNVNHLDFLEDAIKRGAVAVVSDKKLDIDSNIICIVVDDVNKELISICERFYDVSPKEFRIVGITGTDGKTTSATITKNIINNFEKCAYIGTNGMELDDEVYPTNNTTPCIEELYSCLSIIKNSNCNIIVMEVSSEALLHGRVDNFIFDVVGFTNITEEHLNVHKTIDSYRKCKFHLIDLLRDNGLAFINGDDENCKLLEYKNMYSYGKNSDNDYVISNVNNSQNIVNFDIESVDKTVKVESPYLGDYNIYNMTLSFLLCKYLGYDVNKIIEIIKDLSFVRGRREVLKLSPNYDIILDYAHTINGIKSILESATGYKRIITVTGSAGGREREKRSVIGNYVLNNSDLVIFTMDDPRCEDVNDIIDEMIGESRNTNYVKIVDRKEAIYYAIQNAQDGDAVLILGKGRDNYMAVGTERISYCDYDVILSFFEE